MIYKNDRGRDDKVITVIIREGMIEKKMIQRDDRNIIEDEIIER